MKKEKNKKTNGKDVVFKFDNEQAAHHFLVWLCESGEQSYWDWMEYREQEKAGDITAVVFEYHGGKRSGDNFGKHPIVATCGRLNRASDDNSTFVCKSCSQTMSWSPSGHYCSNESCREFNDTPEF